MYVRINTYTRRVLLLSRQRLNRVYQLRWKNKRSRAGKDGALSTMVARKLRAVEIRTPAGSLGD